MAKIIDGGLFITLEGIGGTGKSTVAKHLVERFEAADYEVVLTKQPGGTPLGMMLRKLLLDPQYAAEVGILEQLFLFAADRSTHLRDLVYPSLAAGKVVICDRYVDSMRVYQQAGGCDRLKLEQTVELATDGFMPKRTLWLDVEPEVGLNRAMSAGRVEPDRYDGDLKMEIVKRDLYAQLADEYPERIVRVDANLEVEDVMKAAFEAVADLIV
jgi:dTMP kinase